MTRKRSGISADRAYRIQSVLVARVSGIYFSAISFKLTNEEIIERLKTEVWDSKEASLAPSHALSYVRGYCEAKRNEIWRYWLAWMLSCDNKLMTNKEVDQLTASEDEEMQRKYMLPEDSSRHKEYLPGDYRSPWQRIDSEKSRHVWKDSNGSPVRDKPFDRKFLNNDPAANSPQ